LTRNTEGIVRRYVETNGGLREQKMDIIYSFLRQQGIDEVLFAGEMAWKDITSSCLDSIASLFLTEGFNIKGIEGCLFPTFPPPPLSLSKVSRRLYQDSVKLNLSSNNKG